MKGKSKNNFFSFVMCANKHCVHIEKAVESILNQDCDFEYEIILVANNCEDNLFEYFKFLESTNNNPMVTLKAFRTGLGVLSYNLNFGIDQSSGEYIVRMDSDDISLPYRLRKTYSLLEENGFPDVLGGGAQFIDKDDKEIGNSINEYTEEQFRKAICLKNVLIHPATTIKKASFMRAKGYSGGIYGEDYELWLRMTRLGFRIMRSKVKLIKYRIHTDQSRGNIFSPADGGAVAFREFLLTGNIRFLFGVSLRIYQYLSIRLFSK